MGVSKAFVAHRRTAYNREWTFVMYAAHSLYETYRVVDMVVDLQCLPGVVRSFGQEQGSNGLACIARKHWVGCRYPLQQVKLLLHHVQVIDEQTLEVGSLPFDSPLD